MTDQRTAMFDAIRPFAPDRRFLDSHVQVIDALADAFGIARVGAAPQLTVRAAMETIEHEAIVQEAYKDSEGVWTWSVGLTAASGVNPLAYKDAPASLLTCLVAYVDRVRSKYLPEVVKAFAGASLTEAQLAAALSFHWNTGAIGHTDWVTLFLSGKRKEARAFLESHYLNGGALKERRLAESALFFDGTWKQTGTAMVYPVVKPSYQPAFSKGKRVDIAADLTKAISS
jgi:lysozyme